MQYFCLKECHQSLSMIIFVKLNPKIDENFTQSVHFISFYRLGTKGMCQAFGTVKLSNNFPCSVVQFLYNFLYLRYPIVRSVVDQFLVLTY